MATRNDKEDTRDGTAGGEQVYGGSAPVAVPRVDRANEKPGYYLEENPELNIPEDRIDSRKGTGYGNEPNPSFPPFSRTSISEESLPGGHDAAEHELELAVRDQEISKLTKRVEDLTAELSEVRQQLEATILRNESLEEREKELEVKLAKVRHKFEALTHADEPPPMRSVEELFAELDVDPPPRFTAGRGDDHMEFLERHYGRFLRYFGAEEDTLFLPALRRYDKTLVNALGVYLSEIRSGERSRGVLKTPTLGKIVPTKKDRGDQLLYNKPLQEILKSPELVSLLRSRLNRM